MGLPYMKVWGFKVPLEVAGYDEHERGLANPPRDGQPVKGTCVLCKRDRERTYVRGDGKRVCSVDLEEMVKSRSVRRITMFAGRPLIPDPPVEEVPKELFVTSDYRAIWWERQFT